MKVSELAKELNVTTKVVLDKLKALKLKSKDGSQELSGAVIVVVRGELKKDLKAGRIKEAPKESRAVPVEKEAKPAEPAPEAIKKKTARAKKAEPKAAAAEPHPAKPKKETPGEPARKADKKAPVKTPDQEKTPVPAMEVEAPVQEEIAVKPVEKIEEPIKEKSAAPEPFVPLKPLSKRKKKTPASREEHPVSSEGTSHDAAALWTAEKEATSSSVPTAEPAVPLKALEVKLPITPKDFAVSIQEKTGVVLKKLMDMRIFANINQYLAAEVVKQLAQEFGYELTEVKTQEQQIIASHMTEEENPELLKPRAPVVTLMGHVDHGKTSLLDRIRKSRIVDTEHGGITQHIGAYSVKLPKGQITFLDTPGHEAFTAMRARGAHITDVVVLVVAADEGIMPQTVEAIDHARAAGVPIVVALNKIDRQNADIERVKKQLIGYELTPEDWGGKTIVAGVSAATGEGVDALLEMILLESEMLELKANAQKKGAGIVVEAHLSRGRGAVSSLIVQSGTLHVNDIVVAGPYYGKIRAMFDCRERPIKEAGPSIPVEILGLNGVPDAGEVFYAVEDEKQGREISMNRQQRMREEKNRIGAKLTLEDLYAQVREGRIKELNVILKADVQGSLEALKDSLEKIPSEEVKVKFIHTGVGDVNASDVILAMASNAIIIAFQVGVGPRAQEELEKNPVDVRQYRIIYDAVNDVKKALEGLLEPKKKRKFLARIEVRQVFKLSKSGLVAGCYVAKGKVLRKSMVDVVRNGDVVFSGSISSLKRFKDDVREVSEGYECGLSLNGYDKLEAGDILEAYEVETIARTIS